MIKFSNVSKVYGKVTAVNHMNLSIPKDGLYCLLGRNGAGKTTFMKLLAGHIAATDGEIIVNGNHISPGHMPEGVNFIEGNSVQFNMKVSSLIDTAAKLQEGFDHDFAMKMVRQFDLNLNKKYKQLSFGMKTMLTTILALANQSKIILLDEPTLGFDAIMRNQFNTLLYESYVQHPRIIIVSTHLIDEIAKVTERLIIIESGSILMETGIEEIDEKAYRVSGLANVIEPMISSLNCIGKTTMGSVMSAYIYDKKRVTPSEGVAIDRMSLQDFFINIVGGNENDK